MSAPRTAVHVGPARARTPRAPGIGLARLTGGSVAGVGLLTVLWAMFLPWLASGPATRDSFQLMGLADRYRFFDAWWYRVAPDVWPFWGPVAVAVLLLLVLRVRRTAGALALFLGLSAAFVGALVLVFGSGRSRGGVRLVELGPTTLVIGGVLTCVGAVGLFLPSVTRIVRSARP